MYQKSTEFEGEPSWEVRVLPETPQEEQLIKLTAEYKTLMMKAYGCINQIKAITKDMAKDGDPSQNLNKWSAWLKMGFGDEYLMYITIADPVHQQEECRMLFRRPFIQTESNQYGEILNDENYPY